MDKIILGKEQLLELKKFIYGRGFRNPVEVMEILDHFACKVEERMENDPALTLSEAMQLAHKDFGVTGFRQIVIAYETATRKKYRYVYWQSFRKSLTAPLYLLCIAFFAFLFYKGYLWELQSSSFILDGYNDFGIAMYCIYLFGLLATQYSFRSGVIYRPMRELLDTSEWLPWILVFTAPKQVTDLNYAPLVSVYCTLVFVYVLIHLMARYRTLKQAAEHCHEMQTMELES